MPLDKERPVSKCHTCGKAKPVVAPSRPMPATRASCIQCVEKHLGAAMVLMSEIREGYAYRLLAIGHLHEAQDEAQAWPQLYIAIRTARKAYQSSEAVPDWESLATAAAAVRIASAGAEEVTPAGAEAGIVVDGKL